MKTQPASLRILHVIPTLKRGGAERLLLDIVNEIQKTAQASCLVVVLNEGNDYEDISLGVPIVRCYSKVALSVLKKHKADVESFLDIVKSFNPHIIHSHLFEAELVSRWHILHGVSYVTHVHNNERHLFKLQWRAFFNKELFTNFYEKLFILKKYKECNNNFIAISKHTESFLKDVLPEPFHENIFYLPNAIDYDKFHYDRFKTSNVPEYRLVSIGRLVKTKNQVFLLSVVEALLKSGMEAYLDILGNGEEAAHIQSQIEERGLAKYVRLIGITNDVEAYLNRASVYVHAAVYEPFGLVLLEAMAAGLPVVTLDGGGNRQLIENDKNGYIIKEENPQLFAEKIMDIVGNNEKHQKMSAYATAYASNYDIKTYVRKLLNYYETLAT